MFIRVVRMYEKLTLFSTVGAGVGTGLAGLVIPAVIILSIAAAITGFWTYVEVYK